MMRREKFAIANIYVPVKRRATLKPETVQEIWLTSGRPRPMLGLLMRLVKGSKKPAGSRAKT